MNKFKVLSSNPNKEDGFVTKLQREVIQDTIFGKKQAKQTFYVSGTKQLEVGLEIDLDLNNWRIGEYPMINPETKEEFIGKWLHVKL